MPQETFTFLVHSTQHQQLSLELFDSGARQATLLVGVVLKKTPLGMDELCSCQGSRLRLSDCRVPCACRHAAT